jgi:predicted transcriptional regulator of viral defense system
MSKLAQKIDILHKSGKTVFSTNELMLLWNEENKKVLYVQISRAKKDGFMENIQRGLYALKNTRLDILELAGNLRKNSYLSFETVLLKNGIIHQWYGDYFLARERGEEIENQYGKFVYRQLNDKILLNRIGIENAGNYFIATTERAICDYFYKVGFQQLDNLEDVKKEELKRVATIYGNKRLEKDIQKLIKLL